jgi:hypothetical protein
LIRRSVDTSMAPFARLGTETDMIYELRFTDGRGASLYTDEDVTGTAGSSGVRRTVRVAARVSRERPIEDARRCLETGDVVMVEAHMGAVAYVAQHA